MHLIAVFDAGEACGGLGQERAGRRAGKKKGEGESAQPAAPTRSFRSPLSPPLSLPPKPRPGTAGPPAELMVVAEGDAATTTPADVECAAAAALDALLGAVGEAWEEEAEGQPAAVRLAPAAGFAARGAPYAVAHEGARAALFYGKAPPPSWPVTAAVATAGGDEEAMQGEEEEEEAPPAPARAPTPTPAERVLSLLGALSEMLPDDAADAATAALRSLSEDLDAGAEGEGFEDEGFAIVAYDAETGSLLAARDAAGSAPLWWGTTPAGLLLIGADPADLAGCFPTATPFPAGALFSSRRGGGGVEPGAGGFVLVGDGGGTTPGRLASFVPRRAAAAAAAGTPTAATRLGVRGRPPTAPGGFRAIRTVPRVDDRGVLCGSVFRVASEGELAGLGGGRVGRV